MARHQLVERMLSIGADTVLAMSLTHRSVLGAARQQAPPRQGGDRTGVTAFFQRDHDIDHRQAGANQQQGLP
jgi:hypothetical protein